MIKVMSVEERFERPYNPKMFLFFLQNRKHTYTPESGLNMIHPSDYDLPLSPPSLAHLLSVLRHCTSRDIIIVQNSPVRGKLSSSDLCTAGSWVFRFRALENRNSAKHEL